MKNKIKYIFLPAVILIIILVSIVNLDALNYTLSWGGNKAQWIYSDSNYMYPSTKIKMKAGDSLYYNGVAVTSGTGGGGIAASDNTTFSGRNTFQYKTIFSDTLKADGLSLIDNARITSDLNVTGDIISDLNFLKGSSTSIGTISTDSLAFITNNTKRIVINKNGYTNFTDTVQMSDYVQIIGNLNVGTNITSLGKVTADSLLGIGYYITDINAANIASGKIDSARIPNTAKIDTANFAHTNSGITEIFNSIVSFATTVTFTVSPVFSALVNFANGLTTTTLTASGTATFNGDMVNNGWKKIGAYNNIDKYTRDTVIRLLCDSVQGGVTQIAHGISNTKFIERWTCIIRDDSTGAVYTPGCFYAPYSFYAVVTSSNCRIEFNSSSNTFKRDTAKFYITISDSNR